MSERQERARRYGFRAESPPTAGFTAKEGSHDDGPGHGMFLGPLGGPAFSRDLNGRFSRWHLQPGMHTVADVEAAFFAVHWRDSEGDHVRELRGADFSRHETATLFPLSHETFTDDDVPFQVTLTSFSPVLPGDEGVSGLPVVVFDVSIEPAAGKQAAPAVDVALFWPNLGGWRASGVTTAARGDTPWPGHHHAGNQNVPGSPDEATAPRGEPGTFVLQRRIPAVAGHDDLTGDVCLGVTGRVAEAAGFSRQVQFKTNQNTTGLPDHEQAYTLARVRHAFATSGRLGGTPDGSWRAHWHEPVGSAVAGHTSQGASGARLTFTVAFDWPYIRFGQGRSWRRRENARRGDGSVPDALALALRAGADAEAWLAGIDEWQVRALGDLLARGWPEPVAGCVVNELSLVTGLGTAWVDGTAPGHEPPGTPLLSRQEHLGLLEGFDEGYFYYNTTDLWHYAFPALSLNWPRLANSVFADLGDALDADAGQTRPVYRVAEPRPLLAPGKLPHDLGAAPEDPFVQLNGYTMRDDPNAWRDANPAFVLATLAHHRLIERPVDEPTWARLVAAAEMTAGQDESGAGVPRHDEFGDSTWDNLALRGFSTYTAALCTGMWAALERESRRQGRPGEDTRLYAQRSRQARGVLETLWNGRFFRAASEGKYAEALMPDSLLGLFYADLCGATSVVPREQVVSHLQHGYRFAYRGFAGGSKGPLLIAEERLRRYARDADDLQVNEVIVGAAWAFAAMCAHYGLAGEADEVAGTMRDVLYGGSGLQFRTPAAVDGDGRFRAPLNLRPLSVWWLSAVSNAH